MQKLQARSRFFAAAETKNAPAEKNRRKQTQTDVNEGDSKVELSASSREDKKGNTAKQRRKDKGRKKTEKNVNVRESKFCYIEIDTVLFGILLLI